VKPPEDLPTSFWCLMTKRETYQLKLEGSTHFVLVFVLSVKIRLSGFTNRIVTGLSGFAQQNFYLSYNFIFPVDLRTL
jgi:hypothetical protein